MIESSFHRAIYLTGPTGSGKTAAGVALARWLGAEILALDSTTLYRGMDIGSAKPALAERGVITHHSDFDFTIIDCPPSIAVQVRFFLAVADAYIVPAIPDRLSVRGSLLLQRRIRTRVKLEGLGTLWSLYRVQNQIHRKIVDAAAKGTKPFDALPKPFGTIIPNATPIAEVAEPNRNPGHSPRSIPSHSPSFIVRCAKRSFKGANGSDQVSA
jgi:cellulose biosynthesis protein BcsQ